jgi:tRNA-modifying protein YgfZ
MQPDTMQSEWQNFLSRVGAKLAGGEVHDFGDVEREHAASLETAALIDLSRDSFVRAAGPHALTFLNGQLSKDLRQLDERHHMLAAYCNPQGRVIALPRLWRQGDELVLQLPAALVEPVLERLRRFILRAKVTLNPDPGLAAIGLIGPQCGEGLASVLTTDVPPSGTLHRAGATTLLGLPGIVPRLEIVLPAGQRAELWQQLAAHATPAGMLIWRWHDIRAGLPTVLPETSAAFVPQMLNLDVLNGISFDKGCYPGQEIVARMHYLGRLKQRLYGL